MSQLFACASAAFLGALPGLLEAVRTHWVRNALRRICFLTGVLDGLTIP